MAVYRKEPRSPLTSEWMSLMADTQDEDPSTPGRSSLNSSFQSSSRMLTPKGKGPDLRRSRSWWSFFSIENNSIDELEASSTGASDRRKVTFDKSVKEGRNSPPSKSRGIFFDPNESILDIIQDRMCGYDSNSSLYQWEERIDRKLSQSPVFGGMLTDNGEDNFFPSLDSDETTETGNTSSADPLSPFSTQSYDEEFPAEGVSNDSRESPADEQKKEDNEKDENVSTTSSKYKEILKRAKNFKKMKETVAKKANAAALKKSAFAFNPFDDAEAVWEPTTEAFPRMKVAKDDKEQTPTEKKAVRSSSLLKIREPCGAPSDLSTVNNQLQKKKNPVSERERDYRRRKLDAKFKKLESKVQSSAASLHDAPSSDLSTKENGRSKSLRRQRSRSVDRSQGDSATWVGAMSALSEDSRPQPVTIHRPSPLTILPDDSKSKMCTMPHVLQNRGKNLFQKIKASTGTSALLMERRPPPNSSWRDDYIAPPGYGSSNASLVTMATMVNDNKSLSSMQSLFEFESKRHAYVAYFQRGPKKATKTVRLYEHPVPPVFPTLDLEVVVQVHASTITESDCYVRQGEYWGEGTKYPLNLPVVPGVAFYGTVLQIDKRNSKASGLKKGDQVTSLVRVGSNSRHLCIGYDRLVKVPTDLREPSTAACLPEIYLSAFQALHVDQRHSSRYRQNSLSNKSILILGGTTKIGRALIELALAAGSRTVYATAKENTYKYVEEIGGIPLDVDPHHWYSLLYGKMDIVVCVDCEGSKTSELKYEHIQTLSRHGKMVLLNGPEDGQRKPVELHTVDEQSIGTSRKLYHMNVFDSWEADMKQSKKDLSHLLKLLAEDMISPKIYERVPLTKVAKAHDIIEKSHLNGFLLCEPWKKNKPQSSLRNRPPVQASVSRLSGTTGSSESI